MDKNQVSSATTPDHIVPFARSVLSLLSIWPALQLSFENSSRRSEQSVLISELATELVGAFLDCEPNQTPETEELEDFLLGWIFGTLDVRIEDESEISISNELIGLWKEWSDWTGTVEMAYQQEGTLIHRIERQAERKRVNGAKVEATIIDEGIISGEENESDNDDNQMKVDPNPNLSPRARAPSPVVDEDGFTLVTKHSHRH
ncbi:hypothetical protein CROQUDRAFT_425945 [Cronartium quercuum f. sp. fusiforme G11]|uniref:Pre-rRNA-processing protein TSR2 n=1 Tax=Cronartium quercuum f. sp. fusiforme G11 TaxID=708437 RepID=A0A9P6NRK0_9BASI|nr:hypothetical protein CROQUDRAFT_425945 [Cronartium quercuum f. sp. fusiforme G11]